MNGSAMNGTLRGGGGSKLLKMQASFQQKQLEEKEYKLINLMEERQMHAFVMDSLSRNKGVGLSRSSSQLSRSPARTMTQSMHENRSHVKNSVMGWDKSYPLRPVQNSSPPKPNKYSGNYGPNQTNGRNTMSLRRRGMSLERNAATSQQDLVAPFSKMLRTQSQSYLGTQHHHQGGAAVPNGFLASSSEDSYTSSRPHSGLDVHKDLTDRSYPDRISKIGTLPRKSYTSSSTNQQYTDSAYSSHSSDRSDIQMDKYVYTRRRPPVAPVPQNNNEIMYRSSENLKNQTFKKQKSPVRKETLPYRSYENSDEEDSDVQFKVKKSERQREEDRRRMQYEMRKREQELLAKIKDQQRELETIRAEKTEVEKQLYFTRKTDVKKVDLKSENFRDTREQQRENIRGSREQLYQRDSRESMREPREPLREHREQRREALREHNSTHNREPSMNGRGERILNREQAKPALLKKESVRSQPSPKIAPKKTPSKKPPSTPSNESSTQKQTRRSVFNPKARNDLTGCKMCGRNFAEDRIEKHEEVCAKTFNKKRKQFDMTKARVKGTDAAKFVMGKGGAAVRQTAPTKSNNKSAAGPKSDWRKKREEFIATLRAAKLAQQHIKNGGDPRDLPPPPPSDTSHYIPCPYCNRRFSEAVADRHIPKCKDIKSNKPK